MDNLKSRFNNLKYEHFKIEFKGLIFEVKLLDDSAYFPNSSEKDKKEVEQFKVIVTNGDKKISFNFYNSIMEREISNYLNSQRWIVYNNTQFKSWFKRFSWGGYDDVKSKNDLTTKRIYYLFYSILNCFARDAEEDLSSFSWFCSNFGYDEDSRTAEKIYNSCIEQQEKIKSLEINEKIREYLREEANQETDKFSEDVKKAIEKAKEE